MKKQEKLKNKVIFLGKLPPPYIGPAVATGILLKSKLAEIYRLFHLDTSDHRDINKLGAFDLKNIVLPLFHYVKLKYMIIRHRPQAVYIPSAQTTVAFIRDIPFILIAKFFRKKVICHLRGGNFKNWYNSAGTVTRWLVRRIQRLVDAQIVLGDCLVDMYADLMPRGKIFVVPNGGDFPVVEREEKKSGNGQKLRVLFLANFVRSKGVLETLHAVPEVFSKFHNIEFIFAGSWFDLETKKEFALFLNNHPELPVKVMGPVTGAEKFALLASTDIFVFPTYYENEGHPWVIIEAMAAGLPIISTDHGAICETVSDDVNGFIIEKKNPVQIAEKILIMASDNELRERMGNNSRKIYENKFTEVIMINKLVSVFDRIFVS